MVGISRGVVVYGGSEIFGLLDENIKIKMGRFEIQN